MKRLLLLILLLLVACAEPEPAPTPEPTETIPVVTPTTTRPPATTTPEPSPTPLSPAVSALDQALDEDGRITISRVVALEPGWLAIHAIVDDEVGDILGVTAVAPGVNNDVAVDIDPLAASPTLTAMLHLDAGEIDEFEFPGPDEPVAVDGAPVTDPFSVEVAFTLPEVTVSNQDVTEAGEVIVDSAFMPDGGWLVIHAEDDDAIGPVLGSALLAPGLNEGLVVGIPWREGTPTLYAVLYEDNGRAQRLDLPGEDFPLLVSGRPVIAEFEVSYPPDIFVLDQPVLDGTFVVERVISDGPAYLVVYFDEDGEVGRIIGSRAIEAGLNEQVEVEVLSNAVTDPLYIWLHEDTNPGDGFDFPANDPPIVYQGRLPEPFTFRTNVSNYVVATDQPLGAEDTVTLPYAVLNSSGWLVVYTTGEDGELGEILGQTPLEPGINRNIAVAIGEPETETLFAVLHVDAGEAGEFEFPGEDIAFRRNGRPVGAPFLLLAEETTPTN